MCRETLGNIRPPACPVPSRESVGHSGGMLRCTETSISVEQDVDRSMTALLAVAAVLSGLAGDADSATAFAIEL